MSHLLKGGRGPRALPTPAQRGATLRTPCYPTQHTHPADNALLLSSVSGLSAHRLDTLGRAVCGQRAVQRHLRRERA